MKNLFSLDSPLFRFLDRVGDLILLNFLFLLCCIPVVTLGAALAGMAKVTQDMANQEEKGVFSTFFRGFAANFKQATASWLLLALFLAGLGCYCVLINSLLTGTLARVLCLLMAFLAALLLAMAAYLFPLLVRYENRLKEHVLNAGILTVLKLPRTIALLAVNVLPALLLWLYPQVFARTLIFWMFLGFSLCSYLCSRILTPVFKELEDPASNGRVKPLQ